MKSPKVSIIILNWNGWKDTIECLESLYRISYPNYEVIVVDNGSANESVQKIKDWADGKEKISSKFFDYDPKNKPVKYYEYTKKELEEGKYLTKKKKLDKLPSDKKLFILKNDQNYGFAEGNNIAIRQVMKEKQSEYILLLNNDTVVDKYFIDYLVNTHVNNLNLGISTPLIYNYYTEKIDFANGKINWWIGRPSHSKKLTNSYSDFLTGCCFMIDLEKLQKVGLFDSRFFCYFEDTDLSVRFLKNGYLLKVVNNCKIYHKIAQSTQKSQIYHYYFARNRLLFNSIHNKGIKYYFFLFFQLFVKRIGAKILLTNTNYRYWLNGIYDFKKITSKK
jgi:GT2 family glycosyltransferase